MVLLYHMVLSNKRIINMLIMLICVYVGEKHMTINIHNLLHLPDVVRNLGPLWSNSCFPFEAANGELLKLFHGSQSVEKQVNLSSTHESILFKFIFLYR